MRFARFSIAGLLGAVGVCALGLACLLHASTPWASAMYSLTLGLLTVALVGVACRAGERRAFWVGFAICGWAYMMLAAGPWFRSWVSDRLVTTKLLYWAYPWLIPEERRPEYHSRDQVFRVQGPSLGEGVAALLWSLNGRRERVDVWVKKGGEKTPSLLLEDVPVAGRSFSGNTIADVALLIAGSEWARLKQAQAAQMEFILEHHRPRLFAPLWSTPPVSTSDFHEVGHSFFGLLWAWIGGWIGRYFYATRDRTP